MALRQYQIQWLQSLARKEPEYWDDALFTYQALIDPELREAIERLPAITQIGDTMQIDFEVNNFLVAEAVKFSLHKHDPGDPNSPPSTFALFAGRNGAGKSSTTASIAHTLAREVPPELAQIPRTGGGESYVKITNAAGHVRLILPAGKFDTVAKPIKCSAAAAGLVDMQKMNAEDRSIILQKALGSSPTEEDLNAVLNPQGIPKEEVARIWERIYPPALRTPDGAPSKSDWDKAHKYYHTQGTALKGEWRGVTGQNWGVQVGPNYLPKNWEQVLEGASEETLKKCITDEQDRLESMIRVDAVDDAKLEELRVKSQGKEKSDMELVEVTKREKKVVDLYRDINERLQKTPRPGTPDKLVECSSCKFHGVVQGGKLIASTAPTADQVAAAQAAYDAIKAEEKEAAAELNAVHAELRRVNAEIESKKQAATEYERLLAAKQNPTSASDERAIDQQREAVAVAERRLKAFVMRREAKRINDSIFRTGAIVKALDVEGLRHKKLAESLHRLNYQYLKPLSEMAGWKTVEVTQDNEVLYGGRRYWTSKGEKFRARVLLQIAVAMLDGSDMLVIDDAEDLEAAGREELLQILQAVNLPTVLAFTYSLHEKHEVPDLAAFGLGTSYWVQDGQIEKFAAKQEVAA